jgi:hypothetical protein
MATVICKFESCRHTFRVFLCKAESLLTLPPEKYMAADGLCYSTKRNLQYQTNFCLQKKRTIVKYLLRESRRNVKEYQKRIELLHLTKESIKPEILLFRKE